MSENTNLLEQLRQARVVIRDFENLNYQITSINKRLLVNEKDDVDHQGNYAVLWMIITFVLLMVFFLTTFYLLLQNPAFTDPFYLIIHRAPQVFYVLIILLMILISYLVSRQVNKMIMSRPFKKKDGMESLIVERKDLEEKLKKLVDQHGDILELLPNDIRTYNAATYLEKVITLNPKLTLEEAIEQYRNQAK